LDIWYIIWYFGIFSSFWYVVWRKIWQPWLRSSMNVCNVLSKEIFKSSRLNFDFLKLSFWGRFIEHKTLSWRHWLRLLLNRQKSRDFCWIGNGCARLKNKILVINQSDIQSINLCLGWKAGNSNFGQNRTKLEIPPNLSKIGDFFRIDKNLKTFAEYIDILRHRLKTNLCSMNRPSGLTISAFFITGKHLIGFIRQIICFREFASLKCLSRERQVVVRLIFSGLTASAVAVQSHCWQVRRGTGYRKLPQVWIITLVARFFLVHDTKMYQMHTKCT
jgi:hypothetical protein